MGGSVLSTRWRQSNLSWPVPLVQMDPRRFVGLESVAAAVEHLQSGRSVGKVYVQLAAPPAGGSSGGGSPKARL